MNTEKVRKAFFRPLEAHNHPEDLPARWRSRRVFDNLLDQFTTALAAVSGRVVRVESLEAAQAALWRELMGIGAREVVVNADIPSTTRGKSGLDGIQVHDLRDYAGHPEKWRAACAQAHAGITGAEALLAETGTVVIHSGEGKSRMVSLLPPVHIVICSETLLTFDLFTWLEARGDGWPANAVLVSGPSKTGDIEQTLTVGVHGPRQLIVIVYQETKE